MDVGRSNKAAKDSWPRELRLVVLGYYSATRWFPVCNEGCHDTAQRRKDGDYISPLGPGVTDAL
jgi:hypothetical protein